MPQEAWWAIVIGVSGVVAMVLTAVMVHVLRPANRPTKAPGSAQRTAREAGEAARPSRRVDLLAAVGRPRKRSVEDNFERALARIDAVDPLLAQRRIGEALVDVGLISSTSMFDDPAPRESNRSGGEAPGPSHRWEDEV